MKEKNNEEVNLNETNKEESFAKYIYELRLKRNLTQKMLADKIKVSDRTISKWENGLTVPDLHNIRVICKELGVSADSVVLEKSTFKDHFHNFLDLLKVLWKHLFNNIFKVIFFIIFILLLVYFINNYNAINIYTLTYESDDITIGNGYFIKSKARNILMIDNIKFISEYENISSLDLELYTLVNGDKTVIYHSNSLDDILLEELDGYPNNLQKDTVRAMTKNMYLNISFLDGDNNKVVCEAILNLKKSFSNNKLAYKSYQVNTDYNNDYKMFLNSKSDLTSNPVEYKSFAANFNTNDTAKMASKSADVVSSNKLESLGYSYDANSDTYTKIEGDRKIIYQPRMKVIYYEETKDRLNYYVYYYYNNDRINFSIYENNISPIIYFKYSISSNSLNCYIGNCENYQSEIDYILAEYRQISAIL